MRQGFVKVAAVTPKIVVADTKENTALICAEIKKAEKEGAKIIVLPELCITGYTCSDLFLQEKMLREARQSLLEIAAFTFALDCIVFVGLPLEYNGKLYNVAAAVSNGKVLGFVPKTYLPNYNEFYEARHFTRGMEETVQVSLGEEVVPMGKKLLFTCQTMPELKIGVELCEDLCQHRMRRPEKTFTARSWLADSLQGFCAAIFMRVPEMGNPRRMSSIPRIISLRKMEGF